MEDSCENDKSSSKTKKIGHGATRHCCYGLCNSDSRYSEQDYMQNVNWVVFPKPHRDLEKCLRWTRACGRDGFTETNVNKWTYMCSKHFVDGNGPTKDFPDPIPATFTPVQREKYSKKRKLPTPRVNPVSKRALLQASETLLSLQDMPPVAVDNADTPVAAGIEFIEKNEGLEQLTKAIGTNTELRCRSDRETQTTFVCTDILTSKIESMVNRNIARTTEPSNGEDSHSKFSFETISNDEKMFQFYTGLTVSQFDHLFSSLGDAAQNLSYWRGSRTSHNKSTSGSKKTAAMKVSTKNQLFMTLMKLRQAFPNKDIAYRFQVSESTVSVIVTTWIQFLFKQTEGLRRRMFPSKELIKDHLPHCFSTFKNVRVIIDCFEIRAQSPRDFAEQGNMYSSYKHNTTFKCLVGISPTGGVSFLSDTYEGSISDKEIFVKSHLVDLLEPGDLVIADRGFLIKDVLQDRKVDLNIPPFLCGRDRLTAQEEVLTKRIARVRIHVERAIERMKKFKILTRLLPLSLKPTISQIVHVIGFLVNYQAPLVL